METNASAQGIFNFVLYYIWYYWFGFCFPSLVFNMCSLIKYFTLGEIGRAFKLDPDELVQQSQVLSGNERRWQTDSVFSSEWIVYFPLSSFRWKSLTKTRTALWAWTTWPGTCCQMVFLISKIVSAPLVLINICLFLNQDLGSGGKFPPAVQAWCMCASLDLLCLKKICSSMVILMFSSVIHFFHPRPPAKKREKKTLTRSLTIMMLWVCCWILWVRMTCFFCVLILSIYLTLDQFWCTMLCRGKPPDMERILSSSLHSAAEIYLMRGSAQRPSINPMSPPRLSNEA